MTLAAIHTATSEIAPPDYEAIKAKQNATWASGDYNRIGVTLQIVGENLAEAMDLNPGSSVLDVAAGNGNATLAFARRWNHVTSTDYVEHLLVNGRERAEAEGFDIRFQIADAEKLPFEDASYDAIVSTFGVMFTPNQQQSASEMLRVCKQGGKIGMANWTPDGFIGQLFKTIGKHVAPPPGVNSPALWGSEEWLSTTFGPGTSASSIKTRNFTFRYPGADQFIEFFRTYYGPTHKAFEALDETGRVALERDIRDLIDSFNTSNDNTMRVPGKYAEIVLTKA